MQSFRPFWGMKNTRFSPLLNGIFSLVLLNFLYTQKFLFQVSILGHTQFKIFPNFDVGSAYDGKFDRVEMVVHRRNVVEVNETSQLKIQAPHKEPNICPELFNHTGYQSRCDYLIAHQECNPDGFFNYMKFFYCDCRKYQFLGYLVLFAWLVALFYLLGDTAGDYFCCSLEKLSDVLNLSPTVAGVTLLPLGNGAPDVFASIAAFLGTGSSDVGLNSVLGGAVFVTCIVVGIISLCVADKQVQIDKKCFVRDISFFLFTITCLTVILITGKVSVGGAITFVAIYVVYAFFIVVIRYCGEGARPFTIDIVTPLLPVAGSFFSRKSEENELRCPSLLPRWMCNSNIAVCSENDKDNFEGSPRLLSSSWTHEGAENDNPRFRCFGFCWLLDMPLTIPRRLTIPIVEEDRWSKGYAVASTYLAPLFLALLFNTKENAGPASGRITYFIAIIVGGILGTLAFIFTKSDQPPRRFLLPWVFGGFFMSIIWFYILANELVALLCSLGLILGINPSLLALTILAWGNSTNDLMSNTALAIHKRNGVQIAISGCYAGPMFNMLIGLGVSMLLGAWRQGPEPLVIPRDDGLFFTMGFLALGLIWSLVVLPQSDMRPNKTLGVGLITIYLMFLCCRVGTITILSSNSIHGRMIG